MRVSPITLVIFIVLAVFSLVFTYFFYSARSTFQQELDEARETLGKKEIALADQQKQLDDLLSAIGYNLDQLKQVTQPDPATPALTINEILKQKLAKRDDLVKEIGRALSDVDASGQSLYLQKTIDGALAAGSTPPELAGTLIGSTIDAYIETAKHTREHEQVLSQGKQKVNDLNQNLDQKKTEIKTTVSDWDAKIKAAWENRVAQREKLIADRKQWDAEAADLNARLVLAKQILAKQDARKATQVDMVSAPDGKVLTYDWKTKRGTVSLGAKDGVKAGYEFDVFRRFPGPDTVDRRIYLAKITLIDVQDNVSLFAYVPSDYDKSGQQMAVGDSIVNRLFDAHRAKKYYIVGYFPRGADYNRESLAGLVRDSGGTVQDKLDLDTDYVIVGVVDEGGMTDWSDEAKGAIAKAKAEFEQAQRFGVDALTVEKFLSLIGRK